MTPATFRTLRLHLGVRQCDIAARIGVSRSALCQYEHGRENAIAPWRILPIADELGDAYLCQERQSEYG